MQGKTERKDAQNQNNYRKYEVNSELFRLDVLDKVNPETVIGHHYQSGHPVQAGLHGQIASIYFNPMHNSYLVMAVS